MVKIRDKNQLAITTERKLILDVLEDSLNTVHPSTFLSQKIRVENNQLLIQNRHFNLNSYENIYVVGFGKSSALMGEYLESILGDRIKRGVIISNHQAKLTRIDFYLGSHPYPSERNLIATQKIQDLAREVKQGDLVIFLISGGGSVFLCNPTLSLKDYHLVLEQLFSLGATISEINILRKHLSKVKGGNLAKMFYSSPQITLVFSDVVDNDLSVIASGPTVIDQSTVLDAEKIAQKYRLRLNFVETPKEKKYFTNSLSFLLQTKKDLLEIVKSEFQKRGLRVKIFSDQIQGLACQQGLNIIKQHLNSQDDIFLGAGETTVKIKGEGVGGRNQEMCLGVLDQLIHHPEITFMAINTDGRDGNSEAAGGIVDLKTVQLAKNKKLNWLDYLAQNDSFNFLRETNSIILTGDTGINLSDIYIASKKPGVYQLADRGCQPETGSPLAGACFT